MPDLYEITRRLLALGCPEASGFILDDRRFGFTGATHNGVDWDVMAFVVRAIWEAHAREWAAGKGVVMHYDGSWQVDCGSRIYHGPDLLVGLGEVLG